MKQIIITALVALTTISASAVERHKSITVSNPTKEVKTDVPVVLAIEGDVRSALVTVSGKEVPCQLDDLNDDGIYDELAFTIDLQKKETVTADIIFSTEGEPREYKARTFGYLSIRDRDKSAKNPKHMPIRSLTCPASSNTYQYIFPHGLILESEMVGYRIYGDHRQSVDLYGHQQKQLELPETMFYPSKEQKANGYGDDVLYTGSTYGCGTLHGWDGTKAVMYENVRTRTYSLLASGPVRAVVETINKGWCPQQGCKPVDVTTRYILYAGHRDVEVDVKFSRPIPDIDLSTGVTDIMSRDTEKVSDGKGLLGCWGKALAGNNPKVYDEHTVGLAVYLPEEYFRSESYYTDTPRDLLGTVKEDGKMVLPNQAYVAVAGTSTDHLRYWFTATCDLETYGFADAKSWLSYLKTWKNAMIHPAIIKNN